MKLIDKDALVAEIEKAHNQEVQWMNRQGYTEYHQGLRDGYANSLSLINTLEVKDVWKDPSQLPKKGEVVVACCNTWEDVICGEFKILELNIGDDTKTYRIDYLDWEYVVKWAYPKDVFPYRDSSILNYPVQFNETRIERDRTSNRALESHKAWEESLLYADRIRGSF